MSVLLSTLILIGCLITCLPNGQEVFYVVPSESVNDCPLNSTTKCHTLSYYIENPDNVFVLNAVFSFQAGVHNLSNVFKFADLENLTLVGSSGPEESVILCDQNVTAGVVMMNISSLQITDMTFVGCEVEMKPDELLLNKYAKTFLNFSVPVAFGLYLNYIYDVRMSNIQVHNSTGYGLFGVNLLGNTVIEKVHFSGNNYKTLNKPTCYNNVSLRCKGGNILLLFTDLFECPTEPLRYSLTIKNSTFRDGIDSGISYVNFITAINRNDLQFINGAGIGLHMMQSTYGIDALINNCVMENNAAYAGANMYMTMWNLVDNSTITVRDSTMNNGINPIGNPTITAGSYDLAMGFYYDNGLQPFGSYQATCQPEQKYEIYIFTMENCEAVNNDATLASGAFIQASPKTFLEHPREVRLIRVRFQSNNGDATLLLFGQGLMSLAFKIHLIECEFRDNYYRRIGNSFVGTLSHQVIYQISMPTVEYENCSFINNSVVSLHAIQSKVTLTGINNFMDNSAINGAGLKIQEGSEVFLQPGSRTNFIRNSAKDFGGAIYAVMLSYRCFFQLDSSQPLPILYFSNNSAGRAGEAVYGNIKACLGNEIYADDSYDIFRKISHFSEGLNSSSSIVSSKANRICLCTGSLPDCSSNLTSRNYSIDTYPGKSFQVSIEAFGFLGDDDIGGQTPAEVKAVIANNVTYAILSNDATQQISKGCSNASYTLLGNESQTVDIQLSPNTDAVFFPAYIRVNLVNCPSGFSFSSQTFKCVCLEFFVKNGIICDIETNTFTTTNSRWIGYVRDKLIAVGRCSESEYCNASTIIHTLASDHLDDICINNHSGTLCGECKPGYSITLGSSKCMKCPNEYLSLLIFFFIAGFLLIAFLSFFDVTVKTGRINGMLFYANVIRLANYEFFQLRQPAYLIFQIMINWINLDFGIISCFYDGFDYYAKAWFNFAFPFYLLLLVVIIIICANHSTNFSKLLPKNILPVLTTLLLICFTKLLRSSADPIPYEVIETEEGNRIVWRFDGGISYFNLKHGFLMIFSILVFLTYVVPFALILTIYPSLQAFTGHYNTCFEPFVCFFRRNIFKLKPLLETYDGPFIIKHRYYTGLLAILRLIVFLVSASAYASIDGGNTWFKSTAVSIICIVLLGILVTAKIYTCPANMIVELLYLVNVTILEFVVLVMQLSNVKAEYQGAVVSSSVALAFITFIGVVIYEKYLAYEPNIYKCLGKKYVPNSEKCSEKYEREERDAIADTNDQVNHVMSMIDENYRRAVTSDQRDKQQQLIQNLINTEASENS